MLVDKDILGKMDKDCDIFLFGFGYIKSVGRCRW